MGFNQKSGRKVGFSIFSPKNAEGNFTLKYSLFLMCVTIIIKLLTIPSNILLHLLCGQRIF
jgi:hypothetical protein